MEPDGARVERGLAWDISTEYVFDFGAEAPGRSLIEPFFNFGEIFEQSLLLSGQSSRSDNRSDYDQIAACVALQ